MEVPVVTLDVIAATQHGDILTGLKKENFRVIDDNSPQTITNFGATDAPITITMLMEFSSRGYYDWFAYQAKYWADAFLPNLQQKDWVALRTFDLNVRDEVDFTQNKDEVRAAISHLLRRPEQVSTGLTEGLGALGRQVSSEPVPTLRVLVAEDNIVNQHLMERLLVRDGHTVVTVADGVQALEAYRSGTFDTILMDIQMPVMDGLEATAAIRAYDAASGRARIPIIALTAHAMSRDRERCLEAGMNDYLSKPVEVSQLRRALAKVMDARAAEPQAPRAN